MSETALVIASQEGAAQALERRNELHIAIKALHDEFREGLHWMYVRIGGRQTKVLLAYAGDEIMCRLGLRPDYKTIYREDKCLEVEAQLVHVLSGNIVGVGQGAWDENDLAGRERWSLNKARKMANKRARMDAILSVGLLRAWDYTVDLEDTPQAPPESTFRRSAVKAAPKKAEPQGYDINALTTWFGKVIEGITGDQVKAALKGKPLDMQRAEVIATVLLTQHAEKQLEYADRLCKDVPGLYADVVGILKE